MTSPVHDALASHAVDTSVGRELHDVPPHLVYEVEFRDVRAVCKVGLAPPADPVTEARVTEYVHEHTSVSVPEMLAVGRDPDHYVAAWHDDAPASDESHLDETKARAMGRGLATLHAETAPGFESTGHLRGRTGAGDGLAFDARERWSDTLLDRVRDRRDYLATADQPTDADVYAAEAVLAFVRDHRELFDAAEREGGSALLHGTYLPDHVGTDGDAIACVVDFEHALVGPPAYDYLRTAVPVFLDSVGEHAVAESTFRGAYESACPLPGGFERRRDAHLLVQTVSYLRALYVQDRHPDVEAGASWFREYIAETVADLRD